MRCVQMWLHQKKYTQEQTAAKIRYSFIRLIFVRLPNDCRDIIIITIVILKGFKALANEINHIYLKLINFILCLSGG